jgi:hypothetical protein
MGFDILDFVTGGFDFKTSGQILGLPSPPFVENADPGEGGLGLPLDPVHKICPGESVTLEFTVSPLLVSRSSSLEFVIGERFDSIQLIRLEEEAFP